MSSLNILRRLTGILGFGAMVSVGALLLPAAQARDVESWRLLAEAIVISQDEAVARARSDTGGRVLDVRVTDEGGRRVYLVKLLLDDGRVRVVAIDAASGK